MLRGLNSYYYQINRVLQTHLNCVIQKLFINKILQKYAYLNRQESNIKNKSSLFFWVTVYTVRHQQNIAKRVKPPSSHLHSISMTIFSHFLSSMRFKLMALNLISGSWRYYKVGAGRGPTAEEPSIQCGISDFSIPNWSIFVISEAKKVMVWRKLRGFSWKVGAIAPAALGFADRTLFSRTSSLHPSLPVPIPPSSSFQLVHPDSPKLPSRSWAKPCRSITHIAAFWGKITHFIVENTPIKRQSGTKHNFSYFRHYELYFFLCELTASAIYCYCSKYSVCGIAGDRCTDYSI